MTETDISKVLIEGDYATIMGVKYKRVEEPKPKMEFDFGGKFEVVSYNEMVYYRLEFPDEVYWYKRRYKCASDEMMLIEITDGETHRLLEGLWFNEVRKGNYAEPYCHDEPPEYDEVEWDEKDNPKPVDDVVDRLIKKYQAQKLWNILKDKWGFSEDACGDIVEAVAEWLPDYQNASGSQNVDTELLVDGFNHCLDKIKGMLR